MLPLQRNALVLAMSPMVVHMLKMLQKFTKLTLHCVDYCRSIINPFELTTAFSTQGGEKSLTEWGQGCKRGAAGQFWPLFWPRNLLHSVQNVSTHCPIQMQFPFTTLVLRSLMGNVDVHEGLQGFDIVCAIYILFLQLHSRRVVLRLIKVYVRSFFRYLFLPSYYHGYLTYFDQTWNIERRKYREGSRLYYIELTPHINL